MRRDRLRRRSQRQTSQPSPAARPRAISCRLEIRRRRVPAGQRFRQHRQSRRAVFPRLFQERGIRRTSAKCVLHRERAAPTQFLCANEFPRSVAVLHFVSMARRSISRDNKAVGPEPPLGPSALDSNDAQQNKPCPGMPFRKDCNRKDDRTNQPPAAPRPQLEPGSLIPAAIC